MIMNKFIYIISLPLKILIALLAIKVFAYYETINKKEGFTNN